MFLISLRTTQPGDMPFMGGVLSEVHSKNLKFYLRKDFKEEELDTVNAWIETVPHVDYDAAEAKVKLYAQATISGNVMQYPQYSSY